MTQQFLAHDLPTEEDREALRAHTASSWWNALPHVLAPQSAVLMGGSADHLLQFAADPKQHRVTQDDLHHALHTLQKDSAREIAHNSLPGGTRTPARRWSRDSVAGPLTLWPR